MAVVREQGGMGGGVLLSGRPCLEMVGISDRDLHRTVCGVWADWASRGVWKYSVNKTVL